MKNIIKLNHFSILYFMFYIPDSILGWGNKLSEAKAEEVEGISRVYYYALKKLN